MTPGLASYRPAVSKIKQLGIRVQLTLPNASTFTTFKPSKKYIIEFKAFINFYVEVQILPKELFF